MGEENERVQGMMDFATSTLSKTKRMSSFNPRSGNGNGNGNGSRRRSGSGSSHSLGGEGRPMSKSVGSGVEKEFLLRVIVTRWAYRRLLKIEFV